MKRHNAPSYRIGYTQPAPAYDRRVHTKLARFAWLVLAYNLAVVVWGAYVRATGSGAGCGAHWPLCNGEVIPRAPTPEMLVEFSHRASSGLALVAVVVLLVWAFRVCEAGHPARRGAVLAMIFMLTEAALGAGLVLFRLVADNPSMAHAMAMVAHLANTFLLLASLALTAHWASGGGDVSLSAPIPTDGDDSPDRGARIARRDDRAYREYSRKEQRSEAGAPDAAAALGWQPGCPARNTSADVGIGALNVANRGRLVGMLAAGLIGLIAVAKSGAVAALGDTLYPVRSMADGLTADLSTTSNLLIRLRVLHPALAMLVGALLVFGVGRVRLPADASIGRLARRAVVVLALAEVFAGFLNLWLLAPVWMQMVHLLMADLLWIALVLLAASALSKRPATVSGPAATGTRSGISSSS